MKPPIVMCNYYGMCDSAGNSVGHTIKVTKEYRDLLDKDFSINLYASPCIIKGISKESFYKVRTLKYDILFSGNSILKRIIDKYKILYNISSILRENGTYFFYQVDFFFFLYILLFYRSNTKKKIFCLIYQQDFTTGFLNKLLHHIYQKALYKIDGVIYTQRGKDILHKNTLWIPDYFYSEQIYKEYQGIKKEHRVVCVGTMNQYKQLELLVDVFSNRSIPLTIIGKFDSKKRFEELRQMKADNIEIFDENLSYVEYLTTLSSAQYSVIPYDMNMYKNRTSGVLLESIYVGCIPIAPIDLFTQNQITGIGYNDLNELRSNTFFSTGQMEYNYDEIYKVYNVDRISAKMRSFFMKEI